MMKSRMLMAWLPPPLQSLLQMDRQIVCSRLWVSLQGSSKGQCDHVDTFHSSHSTCVAASGRRQRAWQKGQGLPPRMVESGPCKAQGDEFRSLCPSCIFVVWSPFHFSTTMLLSTLPLHMRYRTCTVDAVAVHRCGVTGSKVMIFASIPWRIFPGLHRALMIQLH